MTPSSDASSATQDPRERLLDANRAYAEQFAATDAQQHPTEQLFVLTCMDARVDPLRMLGLDLGAAHVMRNAGGRVSDDAVRSLVLSSVLLDTRHVMVIHHTDCGLGSTSDEGLRADLRSRGVDVGNLWTGAFGDVEDSVREDVATLRSHPLIDARLTVSGYVFDVHSGELRVVDTGDDGGGGANSASEAHGGDTVDANAESRR